MFIASRGYMNCDTEEIAMEAFCFLRKRAIRYDRNMHEAYCSHDLKADAFFSQIQ